ncbi:MAG: hypothetical protein R3A47_00545 [Polyangiales bacterium]
MTSQLPFCCADGKRESRPCRWCSIRFLVVRVELFLMFYVLAVLAIARASNDFDDDRLLSAPSFFVSLTTRPTRRRRRPRSSVLLVTSSVMDYSPCGGGVAAHVRSKWCSPAPESRLRPGMLDVLSSWPAVVVELRFPDLALEIALQSFEFFRGAFADFGDFHDLAKLLVA